MKTAFKITLLTVLLPVKVLGLFYGFLEIGFVYGKQTANEIVDYLFNGK